MKDFLLWVALSPEGNCTSSFDRLPGSNSCSIKIIVVWHRVCRSRRRFKLPIISPTGFLPRQTVCFSELLSMVFPS